ncbi:GNAT family N-acetyltransferase [Puniceibacterium sp. IMCC21224]|uniref:GNAT family N-acetyltransferase n=1 Tax=Puniceibacterium sp. IMCC21224 TaxID=1618204 RepID=UPI00064DADBC|nr:GNAT family N-acetyltransferase [Puniceibacterium sp. IMCC21224]
MLRPAISADAPAIATLWNDIIARTAFTFTTLHKTEAGLIADITSRGGAFHVALDGDTMLGFATYSQFRGGPGYARTMEHSVMLAPAARGHGVGRALMQVIEGHAQAQGVHSLWAGISAENLAAVAFHAAIGFREIAVLPEVGYKFGRWMDLVLMQKML